MSPTLTLSPAVPGSATASTFKTVQDEIIQTARLDPTADLPRVKAWINNVRQNVASETRCYRSSGTASLSAGVSEYTLDPKILHIELITITPAGAPTWFPLREASLDEILNYRAMSSASAGPSSRYCLEPMNTLELWPTPSGTDVITFWYSYIPTDLSEDGDTFGIPEPHAADLHAYGGLVKAAEFKRDILMLGDFQAQMQGAMEAFQRFLNRKAGAYPGAFPTWTRLNPFAPHDPSMDIPSWDWGA